MKRSLVSMILMLLIVTTLCSLCHADSTDDRVAAVQQKLGLSDLNTAYLKEALQEPVGTGTRLDEAEALVQTVQQGQLLTNQKYFDLIDFWLGYTGGKSEGFLKQLLCTTLGLDSVCQAIDLATDMNSLVNGSHPAIKEWNITVEIRTVSSYLAIRGADPDNDADDWALLAPIWKQMVGWDQVDGSDGKTREQALHDYCRMVWKQNEKVQAVLSTDIPAFVSYIRSQANMEVVIKVSTTGSSTPLDATDVPSQLVFDSTFSTASRGHSITFIQWTWPNGVCTNNRVENRAVFQTGDYTVSLLIRQDDGREATTTKTISVYGPYIQGQQDSLDYRKFTFSGKDTPLITGYTWNFGDGTPSATGRTTEHTFTSDGDYNISLTVTTSSGSFTNNRWFHVGATGPTTVSGMINQDEDWTAAGSPYIIQGLSIAHGVTLTIHPGTIVKLDYTRDEVWCGSMAYSLNVYGHLVAQGTAASPIYFTSVMDDSIGGDTYNDGSASSPSPGDWSRILISGVGASGVFDHCVVRYGGWGGEPYSVVNANLACTSGGTMSVTNCTVTKSATNGIYYDGSANPEVIHSTIMDNGNCGVYLGNSSSPVVADNVISNNVTGLYGVSCQNTNLSNNTFSSNRNWPVHLEGSIGGLNCSGNRGSGNALKGIYLYHSHVDADCTLHADNDFPYVVAGLWWAQNDPGLTVNAGATLTMDPGAIVKFVYTRDEVWCGSMAYSLNVYGHLVAQGTAASPIYFTSVMDDSIGGDTYNDGSASSPSPGDWSRILISGVGASGVFDHCVVRYGGWGGEPYSVVNANLACTSGGTMSVTNCTVTKSATNGIYYDGSANPEVIHSTIMDNGNCGVYLGNSSSPVVADNVISNNVTGLYGVSCQNTNLSNNTFSSNRNWPVHLEGSIGGLNCSGNRGSGNALKGIYLYHSHVDADCTLHADNDFPYVVAGLWWAQNDPGLTVNAGATLTMDPGAIVKFVYTRDEVWCGSMAYSLNVYGHLVAQGTAASPIYFTSVMDDSIGGDTYNDGSASSPSPGDWSRILISGVGASGVFDHCVVRYGGWGGEPYSVVNANLACTSGGTMSVTNCTVTKSATNGIYYDGSANPEVIHSTIMDNGNCGVYLGNSSSPVVADNVISNNVTGLYGVSCQNTNLSNNTFSSNRNWPVHLEGSIGGLNCSGNRGSGNALKGIYLYHSHVDADCTLHADNDFPYVVAGLWWAQNDPGLTVNAGATLTMDPGAIVKFVYTRDEVWCGSMAYSLNVSGHLVAQGTAASPIYFTSVMDDSIGGDTYNDGSASSPSPGDWSRILISGVGASGVFDHCVVRYGGWGGEPYSVVNANLACTSGGTMSVTNCTVTKSATNGIYADTLETKIRNCIISYNNSYGVYITGGSMEVTYCDLWSNSGNYFGNNPVLTGNIEADPIFADAVIGDYRLQHTSPCIDSGDPSLADPDGTRSDMGAYRFSDHTPLPGIGDTKSKEDGQPANLRIMYVTAAFPDFFYIEDQSRCMGIRVDKIGHTIQVDSIVSVAGVVQTTPGGEKHIAADSITQIGTGKVKPMFVNNKAVGGGDWQYDKATSVGQCGVIGGSGLNNIALLVATSGTVTHIGGGYLYIDDGSKLSDGTGNGTGIRVICATTGHSVGDFMFVTGISSCYKTASGDIARQILMKQ